MKLLILVGIVVFGTLGGWLGSLIDGSMFGIWGILLGTAGSLFGVWAGYKAARNISV